MSVEGLLPYIAFAFILSLILASYRLLRGPTAPDRVLASDLMVNVTTVLLVLLSLYWEESMLLDLAILVALLGFIGTLTISKYLEGRDVAD